MPFIVNSPGMSFAESVQGLHKLVGEGGWPGKAGIISVQSTTPARIIADDH